MATRFGPILRILGLLFLAAGSCVAQCQQTSSRASQGPKFSLLGRVVNATDDTTVSFVTIKAEGPFQRFMTVTDGQGHFQLLCLDAGSYWVEASKHGYETATEQFSLLNGGLSDAVIRLVPSFRVMTPGGAAVDARQSVVPGNARKAFASGMKKLYDGNNPAGSAEDFRKAIALHPDYDEAYVQLGIAYGRLSRMEEAEQALRHAIEKYSENAAAYTFLGKLLAEQGRSDEAVAALRRAVVIDGSIWLAHLDLARVLAKQGKKQDAYEHASRAHQLNTAVEDVHLAYYNACVGIRAYAEALAELDEIVRLYPKSETAIKLQSLRPKLAAEPTANKAP